MTDPSPLDEMDKNMEAMFKQGDHNDYLKLYNKYAPAVLGVLMRTLGDRKLAEDCVNTVFLEIWEKRFAYNPDRERLFTWMLKIARSCAKAVSLSGKKYLDDEIREEIDLVYATDIRAFLHEKRSTDGEDFAAKISAEIKQAINLIYFEGFSFSAAAEQLNLSVETLRGEMVKTIKQLKGALLS